MGAASAALSADSSLATCSLALLAEAMRAFVWLFASSAGRSPPGGGLSSRNHMEHMPNKMKPSSTMTPVGLSLALFLA